MNSGFLSKSNDKKKLICADKDKNQEHAKNDKDRTNSAADDEMKSMLKLQILREKLENKRQKKNNENMFRKAIRILTRKSGKKETTEKCESARNSKVILGLTVHQDGLPCRCGYKGHIDDNAGNTSPMSAKQKHLAEKNLENKEILEKINKRIRNNGIDDYFK